VLVWLYFCVCDGEVVVDYGVVGDDAVFDGGVVSDDCVGYIISKSISVTQGLLLFTMATIMFENPRTCESCGAHNFKIHGVIYNGDLNYSLVTVKCMRCGTIAENIRKENK